MHFTEGRIIQLILEPAGMVSAWITCPIAALPAPGRFSLANVRDGWEAVLPTAVFSGGVSDEGFLAVGNLPPSWLPGVTLQLRGPLGRGFRLAGGERRLALAACGETARRLMPLAEEAARSGADVAWFSDLALPHMPAEYELNPLRALPDALTWADFLALDLPLKRLLELRAWLGQSGSAGRLRLPCPAQALIHAPVPCGGIADCGVCAVPGRRGWMRACQDGPVFDLEDLAW